MLGVPISSSLISIIFDFRKFKLCQNALIFTANLRRKYAKTTIRFAKYPFLQV